jgi:RNA polymerase sigma-70 factor (ECF subfamily)
MHRAREHVQARRPRFDVDAAQQREVTQRFLAAAMGGDLDELMTVLAPDVTLITDGGGKVKAALRPITGAAKVARGLAGAVGRRYAGIDVSELTIDAAEINGGPGILVTAGGKPFAAVVTVVAGGRITAIQIVANPDKLRGLTADHTLSL